MKMKIYEVMANIEEYEGYQFKVVEGAAFSYKEDGYFNNVDLIEVIDGNLFDAATLNLDCRQSAYFWSGVELELIDISPQEILDYLNGLGWGKVIVEHWDYEDCKGMSLGRDGIYDIDTKTISAKGISRLPLPLNIITFTTHREALAYMKEHFKPQDIISQIILDYLNSELNYGEFFVDPLLDSFRTNDSASCIYDYIKKRIPAGCQYLRGLECYGVDTDFNTHKEAFEYIKTNFKPLKDPYKDWCTVAEIQHLVDIGKIEKLKTDDRVCVADEFPQEHDTRRYFSFAEDNWFYCFRDGMTAWSSKDIKTRWDYIKLHKDEE